MTTSPCATPSAGHLAGGPGPEGPNPLFFDLFLSYCALMLSDCSTVAARVPVLDPDSEAVCMHSCALFTSCLFHLHADSRPSHRCSPDLIR